MADSLSSLIAIVPCAAWRRGGARATVWTRAGGILRDARALFEEGGVLMAHAGFVAGRLGTRADAPCEHRASGAPARATQNNFDVLELFAFVRPGLPFVPSASGTWHGHWGLEVPHTPEDSAARAARNRKARCWTKWRAGPTDVGARAGAAGRHPGARRLALGAAAESHHRRSRRTARPLPDWKPGAACRNGKTKRRSASRARQRHRARRSARAAPGGHGG